MTLPQILIIGRPNVGKSTLFNYWVGHRLAIESKIAGTTRDFIEQEVKIQGCQVQLIDTAGFEKATTDKLLQEALKKTQGLIKRADIVLFLVSATDGLHNLDKQIADILRKSQTPVIFAAAQADNSKKEEIALSDFWSLGLEQPLPFSVKQRVGIDLLEKKIIKKLKLTKKNAQQSAVSSQYPAIRLALLGRPNVGKSSILNALLGQERSITSDIPGTTRDIVEIPLKISKPRTPNKRSPDKIGTSDQASAGKAGAIVHDDFIIIDTAGLRRVSKRRDSLEFYSADRSQKAIDHADVVGVVIDSHEGVTKYDLNIGRQVVKSGRGLFFIANKWDLLDPDQRVFLQEKMPPVLRTFATAPMVAVSALTKRHINEILLTASDIQKRLSLEISTSRLNRLFDSEHNILFLAQKGVNPPLFEVSVRGSKIPPPSYKRYLENKLREQIDLRGIPVRWRFIPKSKWSQYIKKTRSKSQK